MQSYEIEIKSFIGKQGDADAFRSKILEKGALKHSENKQLNHYFVGGDYQKLALHLAPFLDPHDVVRMNHILTMGKNHSARTRDTDGEVRVVIKSSVDSTTSENGIQRMEFEVILPISLDELDQMFIDSGFEYQAKWSRNRELYHLGGTDITLDKNAGYGFLSEFERVVDDASLLDKAEQEIRSLMDEFGIIELDQERLTRMFDYYNENWRDYYGTDKVFTIL